MKTIITIEGKHDIYGKSKSCENCVFFESREYLEYGEATGSVFINCSVQKHKYIFTDLYDMEKNIEKLTINCPIESITYV